MPKAPPERLSVAKRAWLLRRGDQLAVAGLCGFFLIALAGYWVAQGGLSGRLIEIDRVDPLTVQYQVDLNKADWPE